MSLQKVITEAVAAISSEGYTSPEQLEYWLTRLRRAAQDSLSPESVLRDQLEGALRAIYTKQVDQGAILKHHPGVSKFTLDKIKPQLHAQLTRRIMASADLIKRNRQAAIEKTLQRFSGWATSIPEGGSKNVEKVEEKSHIRKALAQLPFEERRVLIDQGHKLNSAINEAVAQQGGAIAVIWHSHWRQPGYNYRVDHKERDQKVYLLKSSWAKEKGLVKAGKVGYYEDVTSFGEEPFCRCFGQYVYNLRSLPEDMLTVKGKTALEDARRALSAS